MPDTAKCCFVCLGKVDLGDVVQAHAEKAIGDEQFEARAKLFPSRTPETKEEMWYRLIFERCYGYKQLSTVIHTKVYRWEILSLTNNR